MSHPYQYVVLRFVPRVDRGECLNVGIVLHSQSAGVLRCSWHVDEDRIRAVAPDADLEGLRAALDAVGVMCERPPAGVDATLTTQGKRFGWLSAPRSTVPTLKSPSVASRIRLTPPSTKACRAVA